MEQNTGEGKDRMPGHKMSLLDRHLGRTRLEKKTSIILLPLILLSLNYMYYGSYIPSRDFLIVAGAMSLAGSYPLARLVRECSRLPHSRFSLGAGAFKRLLPIAAGFLFFSISYGVGFALNSLVGAPVQEAFTYKKRNDNARCLNVMDNTGQLATKLCFASDNVRRLPERGEIKLSVRRSWYGASFVMDYVK